MSGAQLRLEMRARRSRRALSISLRYSVSTTGIAIVEAFSHGEGGWEMRNGKWQYWFWSLFHYLCVSKFIVDKPLGSWLLTCCHFGIRNNPLIVPILIWPYMYYCEHIKNTRSTHHWIFCLSITSYYLDLFVFLFDLWLIEHSHNKKKYLIIIYKLILKKYSCWIIF